MLYELLYPLKDQWGPLNVFGYISFRAAAAMTTALFLTLFLYPAFIRWLRRRKLGQEVRDDGPQSHLQKQGTPTMGGLLIMVAIVGATLLWGNLSNPKLWMLLAIGAGFLAVGFADDWNKISRKSSAGLSGKARLAIEFVSLCSVARPGRHWFRQRAEAGGARARRSWPRRRQSAMGTHRRSRCCRLTLFYATVRTTSSPTTSRESASLSCSRRLGPPPRRAPAGSRHAPTAAPAARPEIARRRRSRCARGVHASSPDFLHVRAGCSG